MNNQIIHLLKVVKTAVLPTVKNAFKGIFSEKYLLYTNIGLSSTLSALGDCLEQYHEIVVYNSEKWDKVRTRNMTIFGINSGIFCHYWYIYLDRRLPGYTMKTVMKKVVIDQFVSSPYCVVTLFLTMAILEGQSKAEMWTEMKEKAWKLYAAEWIVWPVAQYINFNFLSTKYRVLYDNFISLGCDVYTSYVKHINEVRDKNAQLGKDDCIKCDN